MTQSICQKTPQNVNMFQFLNYSLYEGFSGYSYTNIDIACGSDIGTIECRLYIGQ